MLVCSLPLSSTEVLICPKSFTKSPCLKSFGISPFSPYAEQLFNNSIDSLIKTALFSVCGAIMIYLIALIIFRCHREVYYLKGFAVLIFSFNYIDLSYNISNDIDKIIFLLLNIRKIFNLPLFS